MNIPAVMCVIMLCTFDEICHVKMMNMVGSGIELCRNIVSFRVTSMDKHSLSFKLCPIALCSVSIYLLAATFLFYRLETIEA